MTGTVAVVSVASSRAETSVSGTAPLDLIGGVARGGEGPL